MTDGDTVRVQRANGTVERLRFESVDAPESDQPFALAATEFVEDAVLNQTLTVTASGRDEFGRLISTIAKSDGALLHEELLKAGMVWWFDHYNDDLDLAALEAEAKASRRGLFTEETPTYPRNWRRGARIGDSSGGGSGGSSGGNSSVIIIAAMPNPSGVDDGNDTVILGNQSNNAQNLRGWSPADDDGGHFT